MEFRILGPLEVRAGGEPVDLGPHKQRALLALLLLHVDRVVPTDRILDELWGDDAAGKEKALWVHISRLRSALEPHRTERGESSVLLTRDHGYSIRADPESVDARRFEAAVDEARARLADDPAAAAEILRGALDLWRGPALQDFAYDDFARAEIARLEELRLHALETRIDADLRRGLARARRRAGDVGAAAPAARAPCRPVDARPLSSRAPGRGAAGVPAVPPRDRRGARDRAVTGAVPARGADPAPRPPARRRPAGRPSRPARRRTRSRACTHSARPTPKTSSAAIGWSPTCCAGSAMAAGWSRLSVRVDRASRASCAPAWYRRLRKGAVPDPSTGCSRRWSPAPTRSPSSRPRCCARRSTRRTAWPTQLEDETLGLLRAVLRVLPDDIARLVLVIDQFEELFTLVDDEAERRRFLANLVAALDDPQGRVLVVLTLRADSYHRPLAYVDFAAQLGPGVDQRLAADLRRVGGGRRGPAAASGVTLEPALLAELLADVIGEPGALPIFQYALTELFDRRDGDLLTLAAYRAMGGVRGALSRRADDLYHGLTLDEQEAARQLFLRLVTITEHDDWSAGGCRRRRSWRSTSTW